MRMTTRRAVWVLLAVAVAWTVWLAFFRPSSAPYLRTPPSSAAYASRAASGDPETRTAAIAELVRRKDDVAVSALVGILETDQAPGFRAAAAHGLGKIGNKKALPALTKALDDKSELVFRSAFSAMGRLDDPRVVDVLKPHLMQDKDPVRADEAAWALRNFPTRKVEGLLLRRLRQTGVSTASINVVLSLGWVGSKRALGALRDLRRTLPQDLTPAADDMPAAARVRFDLAFAVDRALKQIEKRVEGGKR